MSAIVTIGIDLAKNVFAIHGVDATGKSTLVRPSVPRAKLLELIAALPPCLIGVEACSGAHHWAREFEKFGHTVRLMAPKFVIPYRLSGKRGKNDAADAAAICEAVTRPNMRFVPIKSIEQQGQLMVHRARRGAHRRCYRIAHARVPCILQMPRQAAGAHGIQRALQHRLARQQGLQLVHHAARCLETLASARGEDEDGREIRWHGK